MVENLMMTIVEITLSVSIGISFMILLMPLLNKRYTVKWRYWIWLIFAIRLLLPFNFTIPEPMVTLKPSSNRIVMEVPKVIDQAKTSRVNFEDIDNIDKNIDRVSINKSVTDINLNNIFSRIWLLGIFLFCGYHFISYLYFRKTIKRWGYPIKNMEIIHIFKDMRRKLNITQYIRIQRCGRVSSPMMIGFINPILILPREDYSDRELYVILHHELIHYRRYDIWYKLVLLLANAVHWFNPLVYIMVRYSNKDMEISCDAEVVKDKNVEFRREYSQTILDIIHKNHIRQVSLSTYFNGGKRAIKDRILGILDMEKKKKGIGSFFLVMIVVIITGTIVACNGVDIQVEDINDIVQEDMQEDARLKEKIQRDIRMKEYMKKDYIQKIMEQKNNIQKENIQEKNIDDAIRMFSEDLIAEEIKRYDQVLDVNIIDGEIIHTEQVRQYDDITDGVIYVYNLQYKLKPEDQEEIVSKDPVDMGDGWMTGTSLDIFPIILNKGGEYSFISTMTREEFMEDPRGDEKYATIMKLLSVGNKNIQSIAGIPYTDGLLLSVMGAISNASESGGTFIDRHESTVHDIKYFLEDYRIEFMADLVADGEKIVDSPLKFTYKYGHTSRGPYRNSRGTMDLTEYDREVEKLSDEFHLDRVPCFDSNTGTLYRKVLREK